MTHIEMLTKAATAAGYKIHSVNDDIIDLKEPKNSAWDPTRWNHEAMELLTVLSFNLEFEDGKVCCVAPNRSVWAIEPEDAHKDRSSAARMTIVRAAAAYYDHLNPEPSEDDQYSFREALAKACGAANVFHNALMVIDERFGGINGQAHEHLREFVESMAASGLRDGSDFANEDIEQLAASIEKLNEQGDIPGAFQPGTPVRKVGGGYQAAGTIVSAFYTLAGDQRYVFEFTAFPGMLHIFGPSQLERDHEANPQ